MKVFFSLIFIILLSNCGFKAVNVNYLDDYQININNLKGDKRIAFLLKNKLGLKNREATKLINMDIDLKKVKTIKEKNINNEITKYEITIEAKVKLNLNEKGATKEFMVRKSTVYDVSNIYSTTINSEKTSTKNLVNDISNKIIQDLRLILNDS